jgi:ribonuclease P protein component
MSGMFTFKKDERLANRKLIQLLFRNGYSFFVSPFKVIYLETNLPSPAPAQVIVTVSKKSFRHAVKRNAVRRIVKEAYRLNKGKLYNVLEKRDKKYAIALIYIGKTIPEFQTTEQKILEVIERLIKEFDKNPPVQNSQK